jgi:CRP/FNR family transcriptional regulator, anaerobic regulatory protein
MKEKYAGSPLPPARPRLGPVPAAGPCAACAVRMLSVCSVIEENDLHRLAAIAKAQEAEAHRTFVTAGDPAAFLFNITEGLVKVYRLLSDGRQQITGFLFGGDFLGLGADDTYAFSAEAVTRVRYCRFERSALIRLLVEFPRMEQRLLGIASSELAAAQEQMVLLGRKTAREKVATFLAMMSRRMPSLENPWDRLELPMSRADIADYLGLTTETVSRTFTQLRGEGLIELPKGGGVRLRSETALAEIGEGG